MKIIKKILKFIFQEKPFLMALISAILGFEMSRLAFGLQSELYLNLMALFFSLAPVFLTYGLCLMFFVKKNGTLN